MSNNVGVPMICATSVMKPGRARIGKIGGNLTLPRTIPIINLVSTGIGAFVGLMLAVGLGSGADSVTIGMAIGGAGGWLAVTYSPLKNESLLKWFELKFKSQTRTRYVDGRRVAVAVGIAAVVAPSSGKILLLRSAVRVPVGQYDERGAVRSAGNANLDDARADRVLTSAGSLPHEGATSLPLDAPEEPRTRRTLRSATPDVPAQDTPGPERPVRARRAAPTRQPEPHHNPEPRRQPVSRDVRPHDAEPDFLSGPSRSLKD